MCKNRALYKGMIYTCQNYSSQWTYYPYNHFQKLSRHPTLNSGQRDRSLCKEWVYLLHI